MSQKRHIIDANVLLNLVRYYLPFDGDKIVYRFFQNQFDQGNFILCQAIYKECKMVAKGEAIKGLPFLDDVERQGIITATPEHHQKLSTWESGRATNINNINKESLKKEFLESGDFNMIACALEDKFRDIVTDETKSPNDKKAYMKIPAICEKEAIDCISLPDLLLKCVDIKYKIL